LEKDQKSSKKYFPVFLIYQKKKKKKMTNVERIIMALAINFAISQANKVHPDKL